MLACSLSWSHVRLHTSIYVCIHAAKRTDIPASSTKGNPAVPVVQTESLKSFSAERILEVFASLSDWSLCLACSSTVSVKAFRVCVLIQRSGLES